MASSVFTQLLKNIVKMHILFQNDCFVFSGHIHPGVRLIGKGKQIMKFPCFICNKDQIILPSFGGFTGMHLPEIRNGDQVFVITNKEIIEIKEKNKLFKA